MSTLPGVAQVFTYGSQKYAVRVQVDPDRLAMRGGLRWNTGHRRVKRGCLNRRQTGGNVQEANKAYFMVRAQVPSESERAKFDQWYGTHHLPLAMDALHADKGWRFWSRSDPSVHYATYEALRLRQ